MHTKANVVLVGEIVARKFGSYVVADVREIWFHQRLNGKPETTLPLLAVFIEGVRKQNISEDPVRAAGWLVLLGAEAFVEEFRHWMIGKGVKESFSDNFSTQATLFEPTVGQHDDISYKYVINLIRGDVLIYTPSVCGPDTLIGKMTAKGKLRSIRKTDKIPKQPHPGAALPNGYRHTSLQGKRKLSLRREDG